MIMLLASMLQAYYRKQEHGGKSATTKFQKQNIWRHQYCTVDADTYSFLW